MPEYRLPDLAYDYNALEPHISGRIMEIHHDKHHATYVEGANSTLEQLDEDNCADPRQDPLAHGDAQVDGPDEHQGVSVPPPPLGFPRSPNRSSPDYS